MRKKRKTGDFINIVAYGGGTNSTAMLIGMYHRGIPVDLILFSDTGGEQPHTYEYIPIMSNWLTGHGMPEITVVENVDCNGDRLSLETECLRSGSLPAIAYGHKNCSLKHKTGPQDKFCNNYPPCKAVWAEGEKVVKFIGFDAGEAHAIFAKIACALDWSWAEFVEADKNQTAMCALFAETDLPCGCYDGE